MINPLDLMAWLRTQERASMAHSPITWRFDDMPQTPRNCFVNSSLTVLAKRNVTYYEGLVSTPRTGDLLIPHAWCFDEASQSIVDQTLSDVDTYWGLPIPEYILRHHLDTSCYYGVLVNHLGFTRTTIDDFPDYFREKEPKHAA